MEVKGYKMVCFLGWEVEWLLVFSSWLNLPHPQPLSVSERGAKTFAAIAIAAACFVANGDGLRGKWRRRRGGENGFGRHWGCWFLVLGSW